MISKIQPFLTTRRDFIKTSGTAAVGAALAGTLATPRPGYCAEANTIKIALVGCGSRGSGAAAQALSTAGPTKLWAMADVFESHLSKSRQALSQEHAAKIEVPPERRFVGFDGYKHAIDSLDKGDVVLLTTPPAFRPIHLEYAVQKGVNVFMEKSFAVDVPGIRRVLKAGELAQQKNLKIAGGLMSRHYQPLEEAIQQVHDGRIGKVIYANAYRMHGPVDTKPRQPGMSELAHQINNYSCFTWLNGSFIVDWIIHNLDVCCWAKNAWPVSVQGMGGRQVREDPDQLFDHYMAEYTFADGTRMLAQGRHLTNCWGCFGAQIFGASGFGLMGEMQPKPRLWDGHLQKSDKLIWSYKGPGCDHYQREHDLLMDAIRNDKPYNETEYCAKSCLAGIMGRMACESGQLITLEDAMASHLQLAPGLEKITSLDATAPVLPDAKGHYPMAMPGRTQVL